MDFEGAFFELEDYELTETTLGHGAFGTVYVAINIKDEKKYAVKIIDQNPNINGKQQMLLMRESIILNKVRHPSIVRFYGINLQSFNNPQMLEPSIITELLPKGSLRSIIDKSRKSKSFTGWNPTKKCIALLGISNAMNYLHKLGILHRDLKPDNILMDDDLYPKICDFGLARCLPETLSKSVQNCITHNIGTPAYMAPELFDDSSAYGSPVDVYAFAIIAYEIVTSLVPYHELGKINFYKLALSVINLTRPKFPEKVNPKMKDLICQCWSHNPLDRPTFAEIFNVLSTDFSYFDGEIDQNEVKKFLEKIQKEQENIKGQLKIDITPDKLTQSNKNESNSNIDLNSQKIDLSDNASLKMLMNENKTFYDIIRELASEANIDLSTFKIDDIPFIHTACKSGCLRLVKYVLSLGKVDVSLKDVFFYDSIFLNDVSKFNLNHALYSIFSMAFQYNCFLIRQFYIQLVNQETLISLNISCHWKRLI